LASFSFSVSAGFVERVRICPTVGFLAYAAYLLSYASIALSALAPPAASAFFSGPLGLGDFEFYTFFSAFLLRFLMKFIVWCIAYINNY